MSSATEIVDRGKDELQQYRKFEVHEGIIFCIELSPSMYQRSKELNNKVQLIEILETLLELMSQVIITLPSTGIGCFFYNCKDKNSANGIYEFLPLEDISASNMKKLSDTLDDLHNDRVEIEDAFPFDEGCPSSLENVFTLAQEQFLREVAGQKAYNNKKIFLFTNVDKPKEASDSEARSRLRKVVEDLNDYFINFVTFFIGTEEHPFDQSFYSDVLRLGAQDKSSVGLLSFQGPNTSPITAAYIKSRALRKKEIKRIQFQCPLILDERTDLIIAVKGYTVISHEKPGTRYKLVYDHEGLRKEAYSHRKYLDSKTGEDLTDKTCKVFKYGDQDIELSEEDLAKIDEDYSPFESFLKLIGFRSTHQCLFYYNNISSASFVVPDETKIEGSIRAMASLFRILTKKRKSALLWGKTKNNSNPSVFVLTPTSKNEKNEGFYLIKMPFMDEIRKFPSVTHYEDFTNSEEYDQMLKVTDTIITYFTLRNVYRPSEFKNPNLQKHFRILHDYLLQIEAKKETDHLNTLLEEDDTLCKLYQIREKIKESATADDDMKKRLSNYIKAWNSIYNKEYNQGAKLEIPSKKFKK
ncbi:LAFE_0G07030g1_1 [Lachancea fermentati]|uniref:ATP-dependent DNA helicase II subunit 1 n=1 Tax=Lachancea fermentati TaxID=4955 RepID=A0A1G4MHG1_LACFM|nr:LAFE_0G07030g1_1 [Lachancea fermentati]